MAEVYKFGKMALDLTDSGKKEWLTAEEDWSMPTEMCTLETGSTTRLRDTEFNKITMEVATKVVSIRITSMVREFIPLRMAGSIQAIFPRIR